jgi:hypothetical protein
VKLKTGDHREGIKGQREGNEKCRDPGREKKRNERSKAPKKTKVLGVTRETGRKERNKATGREKERKGRKEKNMLGSGAVLGGYPIW